VSASQEKLSLKSINFLAWIENKKQQSSVRGSVDGTIQEEKKTEWENTGKASCGTGGGFSFQPAGREHKKDKRTYGKYR
jgi:hypothetical protein